MSKNYLLNKRKSDFSYKFIRSITQIWLVQNQFFFSEYQNI